MVEKAKCISDLRSFPAQYRLQCHLTKYPIGAVCPANNPSNRNNRCKEMKRKFEIANKHGLLGLDGQSIFLVLIMLL